MVNLEERDQRIYEILSVIIGRAERGCPEFCVNSGYRTLRA